MNELEDDAAKDGPFKEARDVGNLVVFGLAAVGLAVVLSLLEKDNLDLPLSISLYCFCISVPFNISFGLMLHPSSGVNPESLDKPAIMAFYVSGVLLSFTGILSIMFHFSWTFGCVAVFSTVISFSLLNYLSR